jgi:hypothetical protein
MTKVIENKNTILSILFIVWLTFTVVYAWNFVVVPNGSTRTFETTKFIFLSISAFGVLFSALLSSFNSLETSLNNQDKINFDRIENTFKYMERWDTPSLKQARDLTRIIKMIRHQIAPEELVNRIEGTGKETDQEKTKVEDLKRSVITMFNFFEEIELSIRATRVNERMLEQAFKEIYIDVYDRFYPWIDSPRNIHIGPTMKNDLARLRDRWTIRASGS